MLVPAGLTPEPHGTMEGRQPAKRGYKMADSSIEIKEADDFEDLGPDDLELIEREVISDADEGDWCDPFESVRREEQRRWLEDLKLDYSVRVVELGLRFAAVFDCGTLTLVRGDTQESMAYFDPRRYSDDMLRKRLKTLLLFL